MDSTIKAATVTPPITYPTLIVGSKTYEIRFTLAAMWQMEEIGLDPGKLREEMQRAAESGKSMQMSMKLLSCCLGNQVGDEFVPAEIPAKRLAGILTSDQLVSITQIIVDALVKAQPAASKGPTAPAEAIQ